MRNKKIMGLCYGLAAVTLTLLWMYFSHDDHHHDHDHDHDHAHEEFVSFSDEQLNTYDVNLHEVDEGTLTQQIQTTGKIIVSEDAIVHLIPKVPGVVVFAKKNIGEKVEEGEVLAVLESKDVADAKAAYIAAFKRNAIKQNLYTQEKRLYDNKITSGQDFLNSEMVAMEAQLEMEVACQKLFALGFNADEIQQLLTASPSTLRFFELRAPFDSSILYRHITAGEIANTNEEAYVLGDLSNVWIEMNISAQDLPQVNVGQPIQVKNMQDETAEATIAYVSPTINDETRNGRAIAILPNEGNKWKPGTFVATIIDTKQIPVSMTIPKIAIQKMDGNDCVFVRQEGGFEIRQVQVGLCDNQQAQVLSGLSKGETVASSNTFLLKADHEKDEAEHSH